MSDNPQSRVDPELIDDFERRGAEIAGRMSRAVVGEIPAYAAVAGTPIEAEIAAHCREHVRAFAVWARAGCHRSALDLGFVRERARVRQPSPIPLGALLRSYLIGQRVTWSELAFEGEARPADAGSLLAATTACFEYADAITAELADAYVSAELQAAGSEERQRRNLIEALLAGEDRADAVADRFSALGRGGPGGHAAIVAVDAAPGGRPDAIDLAEQVVARGLGLEPGRGIVCPRHADVVALVPLDGVGPGELRERLERTIADEGSEGLAWMRIGIGLGGQGARDVARGYTEANRALRHAGAATPVVALAEVRLTDYVAASADATAERLVEPGLRALIGSEDDAGRALRSTLAAFAEQGMNVSAAAKQLFVHPNTVRYRLRKVAAETGLDPLRFEDLDELLTALRVSRGRSRERANPG